MFTWVGNVYADAVQCHTGCNRKQKTAILPHHWTLLYRNKITFHLQHRIPDIIEHKPFSFYLACMLWLYQLILIILFYLWAKLSSVFFCLTRVSIQGSIFVHISPLWTISHRQGWFVLCVLLYCALHCKLYCMYQHSILFNIDHKGVLTLLHVILRISY